MGSQPLATVAQQLRDSFEQELHAQTEYAASQGSDLRVNVNQRSVELLSRAISETAKLITPQLLQNDMAAAAHVRAIDDIMQSFSTACYDLQKTHPAVLAAKRNILKDIRTVSHQPVPQTMVLSTLDQVPLMMAELRTAVVEAKASRRSEALNEQLRALAAARPSQGKASHAYAPASAPVAGYAQHSNAKAAGKENKMTRVKSGRGCKNWNGSERSCEREGCHYANSHIPGMPTESWCRNNPDDEMAKQFFANNFYTKA